MNLAEFLVWLTSGGSIIAVSWAFEKWAWFQNQAAEKKEMIVYGASAFLSILAYCFNTYASPELMAQLAPFFVVLASTFASIFLGKMFHRYNKQAKG